MNKLLLTLLVVAGAVTAIFYSGLVELPGSFRLPRLSLASQQPPSTPQITILQQQTTPKSLAEYAGNHRARYRLQPDRRFMPAIAIIHHFLTGLPQDGVEASFRDGVWQIRYRQTAVGTLPEVPSFADFIALLKSWTSHVVAANHVDLFNASLPGDDFLYVEKELAGFTHGHAMAALKRLNNGWNDGVRSLEALRLATTALIYLGLQHQDAMESTPSLACQAIAFFSLTKTLGPYDMTRQEVLLAHQLGYTGHAVKVAGLLQSEDVVRAYALENDRLLHDLAKEGNVGQLGRYLQLLRFAERRDLESWQTALAAFRVDEHGALAVLKTGLNLDLFATNQHFAHVLPPTALIMLAQQTDLTEIFSYLSLLNSSLLTKGQMMAAEVYANAVNLTKASGLVAFLEKRVALLQLSYKGPFLDGDTCGDFYRGHFYTGLYRLGIHYVDSLASLEATEKFANYLGDSQTPLAADFQVWYRNLARANAGKSDQANLLNELSTINWLGGAPLLLTLDKQQRYHGYGAPESLAGVAALIPKLDSRPAHRASLARLTYDQLMDLPLAESFYTGVLEEDPANTRLEQVFFAKFSHDLEKLRMIMGSERFPLPLRLDAAAYLHSRRELPAQELDALFDFVYGNQADHSNFITSYAEHLLKTGQHEKLRQVCTAWLEANKDYPSLLPVNVRTKIALSYQREGLLDEAWKAIEPAVASYKASAMLAGADILEDKGEMQAAEKLRISCLERYPMRGRYYWQLAIFYWRQGQIEQAAAVLARENGSISIADWRHEVGGNLGEIFAKRSDQELLQALESLQAKGVKDQLLFEVVRAVGSAGRLRPASTMLEKLHFPGLGQLAIEVRNYAYRKQLDGQPAATAWLATRIPPPMRPPLSTIAFREGQHELLWTIITDPDASPHGNYVWLMRALAHLLDSGKDAVHHQALHDYYHSHIEGHYNLVGRYLLDLEPESKLLPLMSDPKTRCEIAYFLGEKALSVGEWTSASNWFQISIGTGLNKNGEYIHAFDRLYSWRTQGQSLRQIMQAQTLGPT